MRLAVAQDARPLVNDPKEIRGWAMYDWANSAFSTTVGTVFLGPYLSSLVAAAAKASPDGLARFFGLPVAPESFLPFCIAFSVVFQAGFLPVLGAIADYSHRRKFMLRLFATLGALATTALFFVQGDLWWLGGVLFIIANFAFGAAIVFYNAYLPDIASADQRDRVSAFGWAMGYLGGGLLLALNLVLFLQRERLGLDSATAVRINLASAGVWWFGWSFWTWLTLRPRHATRTLPPGETVLGVAFKQLSSTTGLPARLIAVLLLSPLLVFAWVPLVNLLGLSTEWVFAAALGPIAMIGLFLWRKRRALPETTKFLLAYLIYNDGIQTVIAVSALFAAAPVARGGLGVPTERLTLLILMIQFVAFFGALFFGRLAGRLGSKRALVVSLFIWTAVVVYAYLGMRDFSVVALGLPRAELEFWVLGVFIALVLGGSQAISRSMFAQMIPQDKEAEFFSIYEISERGTSWLGPFIFGAVNQTLGDLRPAVLSVVIFFVVGLAILLTVNAQRAFAESGPRRSDQPIAKAV
ncbi:MAG: MFS transporter [Anaerolineae bacterium]|nr:MFS transporter [Thermoflexales bacterium]MDW8054471.1 MFS transporter [Anaerolineae bacterium]